MASFGGLLVNIDVDDLDKAVAFYGATFQLSVGRRFGRDAVELLGLPVPIHLLVKGTGTAAGPAFTAMRSYARHWTPVHIDFVVGDIEAAVELAVRNGARLEVPVHDGGWGRHAILADPFGNGFCLVQFIGRGYDEIAT